MRVRPPVVIIAGPTASGKSALALELAEAFGGTIINADALQIYRDLPILTHGRTPEARARVPHRLYGVLDASERGSAGRWRARALGEITAAHHAGRLPFVVGGTGLYLRALRDGLAAIPPIPPEIRAEAAALYGELGGAGVSRASGDARSGGGLALPAGDRQRLMRAFEVVRATGTPIGAWQRQRVEPAPYRFVSILLMPPREALYAACDTPLRTDDRRRRARRGGGDGCARARPRSAGDESGRRAGIAAPSARRNPARRGGRAGAARDQALRQAPDDMVSPPDDAADLRPQ